MTIGIAPLISLAVVVVVCIESKLLLKRNDITGRYSKLKPRWIHLRNNLQVKTVKFVYMLHHLE